MTEIEGLKLTKTHIEYRFPFNLEEIEKAKVIGMIWSNKRNCWFMKRNLMNEHLMQRQFGGIDDEVVAQVRATILDAIGHYTPHPLLMAHQLQDVKLAAAKDRHLFGNDTGTGKTFEAIEIIKLKNKKALVICPLSIINSAWFEDLDKFRPELKKTNLWKHWKRQKRFYEKELHKNQVCIVNFESFKTQYNYLMNARFELIIIDESSKIKNPKSKITKEVTKFCDTVKSVYLFSGTPAPNHDMEWFPQVRIVDPMIFGMSFYKHRTKFFYNPGEGFKWFPFSDKRQEFLDGLEKAVTVIKKEDVLDLPERTFNMREVILSSNERRAYNQMAKDLVAEIEEEEITASNAAVKIMKLRQVTAGFMFNEDGVAMRLGTSKQTELLSLLEEIGNHQVIIWTQFQYEARQIMEAFSPEQAKAMDRHGVKLFKDKSEILKYGVCNGTVNQEMKDLQVQMFKDGDLQYMIAHPRSMGHGHTLVNANYSVYNSQSYSSEENKQSHDRNYRKGQRNACSYYYLLAKGTIDHVVFNALRGKAKMEAAVLDYIKGALKAKTTWSNL